MLRRWSVGRLTSVSRSQVYRSTIGFPPCPRTCSRSFQSYAARQAEITPLRKQLKDIKRQSRSTTQAAPETQDTNKHDRLKDWELTVGIEIHAQLNTSSKLFSCEQCFLDLFAYHADYPQTQALNTLTNRTLLYGLSISPYQAVSLCSSRLSSFPRYVLLSP